MYILNRTLVIVFATLLLGCSTGNGTGTDLSASDFSKKIREDEQAVIIDVRTPQEFEHAHIPGAKMIDYYSGSFKSDIEKLDKNGHYYLYCRSGNRSGQTLKMMTAMGFKHVSHLAGGMNTWKGETVSGS